tara:strand:+ start:128 stop:367 length:240 start_codon:yes stop_codon:yes gene_type:complete
MKLFEVGDLVISAFDPSHILSNNIGLVLGKVKHFDIDVKKEEADQWIVYRVYWPKANQEYPVFGHDLVLFRGYRNENIV